MRIVATAAAAVALVAVGAANAAETPLVVRTTAPSSVLFGDTFPTRVTVTVDPDEVDVASIRVSAPLAPMTQVSRTQISRQRQGSHEAVAFDAMAACLAQRCVAASGPQELGLATVRVSAATRDGRPLTTTAAWPRLTIRGRVSSARDSTGQFRTDLDTPPVTYRVAPERTSSLLFLAALALAAVAIVLAGLRTLRLVRRRHEVPLTDLERALLLARQSEGRPPADRRRALGLLARVLGTREQPLAEDASTLAWSAPEPTPDSVSSLVDDVGQAVGAR